MNRNLDKLYLNENKTQKRTLYMLACYQTKIGGSLKLVVANFCGVRAVFFSQFRMDFILNNSSALNLIKDHVNHIKLTLIC